MNNAALGPNLDVLMDVNLEVSAEVGGCKMSIQEILSLGAGSIVEFTRAAGEPIDLLVNGRVIARGEIIAVDDRYGLRITEVLVAQQ